MPDTAEPGTADEVWILPGHLKTTVRQRMLYTGERYQSASEEIAAFGPLPAAATLAQEWLEYCIIDRLGESHLLMPTQPADTLLGDIIIWPEDTVIGIHSVTPRLDELLLHIHLDALPALLAGWLPTLDPETESFVGQGIPGLRPRLTRRGLELMWPNSGARIVIPRVTRARWSMIEALLLDPQSPVSDDGAPIWHAYPDKWIPVEQTEFTEPGSLVGHPGFPEYTWIDSGLLRRAGLFRSASANCLYPCYPELERYEPAMPDEMRGRSDLLPVQTDERRDRDGGWIGLPIDYGDGRGDATPWAIRKPTRDESAGLPMPWQPQP